MSKVGLRRELSAAELVENLVNFVSTRQKKEQFCLNMKVGQWFRQGDVYVMKVDDNHPHGEQLMTKQLVTGNTQGSRHIIENDGVMIYSGTTRPSGVDRGNLLGPCFKSIDDYDIHLIHPEHDNFTMSRGTYQTFYQMDALTRRRVLD